MGTALDSPVISYNNSDRKPSKDDWADDMTLVALPPQEELLYLQLKELDLPVLTIFWKPNHKGSEDVLDWAQACKQLAGNTFELVPVEQERYPTLARRFGVTQVPTVLLLLNGKVVDRLEGDYQRFHHWITGGPRES